jgi:hypothetical protein
LNPRQETECLFGAFVLERISMSDKTKIESDARGQYGRSQADPKNNGLASATPRTVTGRDDATLENAGSKPSPNPGFDRRSQTDKSD